MQKVYIIAEAGVNHNGDLNTAKKLIDEAKKAGADAVKFQTFKAENLASKTALKAAYQKQTTDSKQSQYEMLKALELSIKSHTKLIEHTKNIGIEFLSTPFDIDSANVVLPTPCGPSIIIMLALFSIKYILLPLYKLYYVKIYKTR